MSSKVKNIIWLQMIVIIYTMNGVVAKIGASQEISLIRFVCFYSAQVMILGIYAILWQQMIRKFELTVAYANRAMALIWSAIWAVLIFHENISAKNIIGILLVIAGTIAVNLEPNDKSEEVQS